MRRGYWLKSILLVTTDLPLAGSLSMVCNRSRFSPSLAIVHRRLTVAVDIPRPAHGKIYGITLPGSESEEGWPEGPV